MEVQNQVVKGTIKGADPGASHGTTQGHFRQTICNVDVNRRRKKEALGEQTKKKGRKATRAHQPAQIS